MHKNRLPLTPKDRLLEQLEEYNKEELADPSPPEKWPLHGRLV